MRIAKVALAGAALAALTGCAGSRSVKSDPYVPTTSELWDSWGSGYLAALAAQTTAGTPAERTKVLDRLVDFVERAPGAKAREMATKDACIFAASEGDAAVLQRLDCENGALRGLLGGE